MFHREGYKIIVIATIAIGISILFIDKFVTDDFINRGLSLFILLAYLFILQQFRNSKRSITPNANAFYAPVDGKIKSIEDTAATSSAQKEFVVSIHVSPFQLHSIKAPFDGTVSKRYSEHIGSLKSGIETIEIQHAKNPDLKAKIQFSPAQFSQNASLYPAKNSCIMQGEEIGFVNFDAKVRLTFNHDSKLDVKINDNVKAGVHQIATI